MQRKKNKKRVKKKNSITYILLGVIIPAMVLVLYVAMFRQNLTVRVYKEACDKIDSPIRIAVLADLHDTIYGEKQKDLVETIRNQNPDIILLVGDIVDEDKPHDGAIQLLSAIAPEYSCYFVTGNHEYWSREVNSIKKMIRSYGITILEGDANIVQIRGQKIMLCGVDDPEGFNALYCDPGINDNWQAQFDRCKAKIKDDTCSILLSHRPELAKTYENSGFDLVVAGHSHGGQVIIPGIINGLYVPNQGLFPKYAGGCYELGNTVMIVSRGLCKNHIPRIFNPPELVIVDLEPML